MSRKEELHLQFDTTYDGKKKTQQVTAPKKTWGGRWLPQGSFFVVIFVTGGQKNTSKSPTSLSCDTLGARAFFLKLTTI